MSTLIRPTRVGSCGGRWGLSSHDASGVRRRADKYMFSKVPAKCKPTRGPAKDLLAATTRLKLFEATAVHSGVLWPEKRSGCRSDLVSERRLGWPRLSSSCEGLSAKQLLCIYSYRWTKWLNDIQTYTLCADTRMPSTLSACILRRFARSRGSRPTPGSRSERMPRRSRYHRVCGTRRATIHVRWASLATGSHSVFSLQYELVVCDKFRRI